MSLHIGVDPGESGSMAVLDQDSRVFQLFRFDKTEPQIIRDFITSHKMYFSTVYVEKVHSTKNDGHVGAFTFGMGFGRLLERFDALGVPFKLVKPYIWQGILRCSTGGNKNISKTRASHLWPDQKIIHATADALLIAEYGRLKTLSSKEFQARIDSLPSIDLPKKNQKKSPSVRKRKRADFSLKF